MNSPQEYQTDLEVILEFLEEHYRQESGRKALWNSRDLSITSTTEVEDSCGEKLADEDRLRSESEQEKSPRQSSTPAAQQVMGSLGRAKESDRYTDCVINNSAHPSSAERDLNALNGPERPLTLNTTPEKSAESLASITPAEKGKKLRLFHFLFEMLEDPDMADCISWVPASVGVFRFSTRHKERVAELWGQRKGNRLPMTYQKMSRAMRNYARSGEIIKVKKRLTYQFSVATLSTLQSQRDIKTAPNVWIQMRAE